jgi:Domain of unknown function (DUF4386)
MRSTTLTPDRKTALIAGVFFVLTFVTAIPAVLLYDPVLNDPGYIVSGGADTRILVGAFLEVMLIIANIGTSLALYRILKRQNEGLALGYVAARIVESGFIAVGVISLLSVVTLRQDAPSADTGSLVAIGQSLVAIHDWTFLLGPGFVVGIGNGLILGYLMYRSGLVPRRMAVFGLVGGPLVCASGIAVMFGAFDAGSAGQFVATVPEIIWEALLGIYLIAKGFRSSSVVLDRPGDSAVHAGPLTPVAAAA